MTHIRTRQGRFWGAFAALICIISALALSNASSSDAAAVQFCWGKNFPGGQSLDANLCFSGTYNINTVYGSGVPAPICIGVWEIQSACEKRGNEGVWLEHIGGQSGKGFLWDHSGNPTKAYGKLWTP